MRIVVYRPGALGDTLLTLPTLVALRSRWPDAEVTLICRGDLRPLALASGLADAAYSNDLADWACLFHDGAAISTLVRRVFGGAEVALVWATSEREALTSRLHTLGVE